MTTSVLVAMSSAGFIVTVTIDVGRELSMSGVGGVTTITRFRFSCDARDQIGRR
jgi:hypothetical protein